MTVVHRPQWTDVWRQRGCEMMRAQHFWACARDTETPTWAGALHNETIYSLQTHYYALLAMLKFRKKECERGVRAHTHTHTEKTSTYVLQQRALL